MKRYLYLAICGFIVTLTACKKNDLLVPFSSKFPSVDKRFEWSMDYNRFYGVDTLYAPAEDYRLYVCTDTHLNVPYANLTEAEHQGADPMKLLSNFSKFINLYRADALCPAALCLGDLVESNITYDVFRYPLDNLPHNPVKWDTMYCTIGNHDVFYSQYYAYRYYISQTATYYFIIKTPSGKKDLYICLDTATGSLGYEQTEWLKYVLSEANKTDGKPDHDAYRHIIVYTHVNIFRRDNTSADISTTAIEETYELMHLFQEYGVKQFWAGHDHAREEFMQGGVKYIIVDSMEQSSSEAAFMILHVGEQLNNTFHFIREYM